MKAPLRTTEYERLEALSSYGILDDTPSEQAFDDLTTRLSIARLRRGFRFSSNRPGGSRED